MSEPAEKLCSESVQPYLGSVLEELMEPISSGFQEGRQLSETLMDEVCQDALRGDNEQVKKVCQSYVPSFVFISVGFICIKAIVYTRTPLCSLLLTVQKQN